MSLTLLAISGHLCSGKTTLADALCAALPDFVRMSLADSLKEGAAYATGVSVDWLEMEKDEAREILQAIGNFKRKRWGERHLAYGLEREIWRAGHTQVIVDDVRLPAEMEYLKQMGRCLSVRLEIIPEEQERRCVAKWGTPLPVAHLLDITETALDDYEGFDVKMDAVIPTEAQVRIVLSELKLRGML